MLACAAAFPLFAPLHSALTMPQSQSDPACLSVIEGISLLARPSPRCGPGCPRPAPGGPRINVRGIQSSPVPVSVPVPVRFLSGLRPVPVRFLFPVERTRCRARGSKRRGHLSSLVQGIFSGQSGPCESCAVSWWLLVRNSPGPVTVSGLFPASKPNWRKR